MFLFVVEIHGAFCRFGALTVDWPHKAQTKSYFPPKGMMNNWLISISHGVVVL